MKTTTIQVLCKAVLFSGLTFAASGCAAQSTTSETVTVPDCAKIDLQYLDSELLTREEQIALLDKILLREVNNIESCPTTFATDNQAVGSGGGLQETEPVIGKGIVESVPASDIQGDAPLPAEAWDGQNIIEHETTVASQTGQPHTATDPNGKLPEDIPEANSDDIIAQQFRQAAIAETDPQIKAKLWNEYRRYKGLPVLEVPKP